MKDIFSNMATVTLLILTLCYAMAAEELSAKVTRAKGKPVVLRSGNEVELTLNMEVKEGETIRTRQGDQCTLTLGDGSKILVFPSSEVSVKAKDKKKIELNQKVGFSWMKVKPLKGVDERFIIRTPTAVAGVRGTSFSCSVENGGKSGFCVCEGKIAVKKGEKEELLKKGEFLNANEKSLGGKMGDVVLLKRPTTSSMSCLQCHQGGSRRNGRY